MNRIRKNTKVVIASANADMEWLGVKKGDVIFAVKIDERVEHSSFVWHFLNVRTAACYSLTATQLRYGEWTILKEYSRTDISGTELWQQKLL